ncbi:MAG: hypothetical protein LV479_08010 [Methylacidiphilales bacterium]|nr:hypothetical protein [Candidatus Methylacidiphilales bacterium]
MQFLIQRAGLLLRLFALALVLFPSLVRADTDLDAANHAYTAGSYEESAKLLQQLITSRGYSASLCFNLGNAEARAGHPGLALLNYERARYLAPGDPDIDHNLQLARKQAGLNTNSYRWWQIMLRSISWTIWFGLIVGCLTLLLIAIIGSSLKSSPPAFRKICKAVFFIFIPLTLLLGFVELSVIGFNHRIEGVIVAPDKATLRYSPFESADSTGTIPEGELVTVEDRHNDYLRIEARNGHYGWIQQKDIEPVVPGSFDIQPSN